MKTYETVEQYEKEAKQNDRIVLAGYDNCITVLPYDSYINMLPESKHDTFKVTKVDNKGLQIKKHQSKTPLRIEADHYDQKVYVLTKKEFKNLTQ